MAEVNVEKPYKDEELENISKKDILQFLQENSSVKFKKENKLFGSLVNVGKVKTKEQCLAMYKTLFETKDFKGTAGDIVEDKQEKKEEKPKEKIPEVKVKKASKDEPSKYTKKVLKLGDKTSFPQKGDMVECYYTGKLDNGKVFDTNVEDAKKKKGNPLKFKVGTGKVIRGWDEALLTMTKGEKAEITIQPEWAYGKKGLEGKIPPNSTLTFEVELVTIS